MRRIVDLRVQDYYRVWPRFDDGVEGEIDFSHKPPTGVYVVWKNYNYFRSARIDSEGQLLWDEQLHFDAESLWRQIAHPSTL